MENTEGLTTDEIKLYDRQIRLWGVEAQANLRHSRILLVNLTSIGVEIAKNLVLGGVGSLTIVDDARVLEQDLYANFFLDKTQVGQKRVLASEARIKELNPRVEVITIDKPWQQLSFDGYQMVIATGIGSEITEINRITRELGVPLYCCAGHGLYGYIYVDLIEHQSTIEYEDSSQKKVGPLDSVTSIVSVNQVKENDILKQKCVIDNKYRPFDSVGPSFIKQRYLTPKKQKKMVSPLLPLMLAMLKEPSPVGKPIEEVSVSSESLLASAEDLLNSWGLPLTILEKDPTLSLELARQAYCEYQPVSSILGGALTQDVINVLVRKGQPINNFAVLDGRKDEMPIYCI